jgi:hypothetical protein
MMGHGSKRTMRLSLYSLALALLITAALGGGCTSEGTTNVWGQRWNIPYEDNTVGAELGIWPRREMDIFVQWVTPRLLNDKLLNVTDEADYQRLATLLKDYIIVRVVAKNLYKGWSPFFEYDRWSLILREQEHRAVVPSGESPTAEGGYFMGEVPAGATLSGWVFFLRKEPGPQSVIVIYDFGYQRTTFSFPPLLRR